MYTSGCPKNQNRCCQSRVDPPECGCSWSLITEFDGTKKLVPATWSRMTRIHAGSNTAKAVSPMHEVMNHAQALRGRRIRLMPLTRRSRVVVMKFNEPSNWPTQNSAMEVIQRTTPRPWPGPATEPTALSGAYWVQPPRVGPSPRKNDDIRTTKARNVTQKDVMLNRGKGMSSAPTWMGRKKLPKAAKGAGVSTKKTMMVPCMVINCRYSSGVITPPGAPLFESNCRPGMATLFQPRWKRISQE